MIPYLTQILQGFLLSSEFIIQEVQDRDKINLVIHNLSKEDYYTIIGFKGENANTLRHLMRMWAKAHGTKITIYIPNPLKR